MADTLHAQVWLADENFVRCTAERTEVLGYSTEHRRVGGGSPLLENTSHDEEVTHLWAMEVILFDVPAGARVARVVVRVGEYTLSTRFESGVTDFPSAATFAVWPLNMEVKERIEP